MVVLVSSPGGRADELTHLIGSWPGATIERVWTGDPQLRPAGRWAAGSPDRIGGFPAGAVRAALEPTLRGLVLGLDAVAQGTDPALVLDAGKVIATRPVRPADDAVGVVVRGCPQLDGLAPTLADLACWGPFSTAVCSATPTLATNLIGRLLDVDRDVSPGVAFAAALAGVPTRSLPGEVLGWPLAPDVTATDVAIIDLVHLDLAEAWRVDFGSTPARVRLSTRPDLAGVLGPEQELAELRAPGGVEIDAAVRRLLSEQMRAVLRGEAPDPPDPWRDPAAFVEWLETPAHAWDPDVGRYWYALWQDRADLRQAFPDPAGDDLLRFREWADARHAYEGTSPMVRSRPPSSAARWTDAGRRADGIDVVGYFGSEMSLSNVADRMVAALDAVGVAHRTAALHRTGSPRREHAVDDTLAHGTVVLVANHDQVGPVLAEHGQVLGDRRLIGFWHWDVEHVPDAVAARMRHFDQIWVLNEYTERTLSAVPGAPPVRSLPLPVPEPVVSSASRSDLGLPSGRPLVVVTFDHLSVTERKNPIGAIEAFRRAVPEPSDDGPLLVVKTMNADQRWIEHERVLIAAMDRPDVLVVDRVLPKADQMALVAHADVMLSLHRAEGLGLHLVEAMWLGTPTIATRYSGNLSFMDDENSLLVDATLVPVERGEGFFPPEATWADPDLDQAASHLRRLLDDESLRRRLAAAGRDRMERQPSFEQIGRTIAEWCGIENR